MAIEVSEAGFQREVLDRSAETTVVLDFWAAWCGPCRAFTPILEAAVEARSDRLALAKVDTEANPSLAAHYDVHGIPAVKVIRRREVVAQFVGARSPSRVAQLLDDLVSPEIDELVAAGDDASLRRAVELDPRRMEAAVALARRLHGRGEHAEPLAILKPVGGSAAAGLAARIRLDGIGDEDLAEGFAALDAGETERGLDILLGVLAHGGEREADVRQVVVSALDGLGFGHPLVDELHRRLSG